MRDRRPIHPPLGAAAETAPADPRLRPVHRPTAVDGRPSTSVTPLNGWPSLPPEAWDVVGWSVRAVDDDPELALSDALCRALEWATATAWSIRWSSAPTADSLFLERQAWRRLTDTLLAAVDVVQVAW